MTIAEAYEKAAWYEAQARRLREVIRKTEEADQTLSELEMDVPPGLRDRAAILLDEIAREPFIPPRHDGDDNPGHGAGR